jgi:hypothetical protein
MEIGAFLLVLILLAVVIAGGLLLLVAGKLRREKLDPEEDRLASAAGEQDRESHPRHRRVSNEQRSEFLT